MKLSVPYHSQFLEVEDFNWNIRSCSGACVAMTLGFLTEKKIDILDYMKEAEKAGGYDKINGANHDYIISYFEKLCVALEKLRKDSKLQDSWIQNEIDNIAKLLYETKYKLVNLQ